MKKSPFDWIDLRNPKQVAWAISYLGKKGILPRLPLADPTGQLQNVIDKWRKDSQYLNPASEHRFGELMKNAWRSQKHRANPRKGRLNILLPRNTITAFRKAAKKSGQTQTQMLQQMIENQEVLLALINKEDRTPEKQLNLKHEKQRVEQENIALKEQLNLSHREIDGLKKAIERLNQPAIDHN